VVVEEATYEKLHARLLQHKSFVLPRTTLVDKKEEMEEEKEEVM